MSSKTRYLNICSFASPSLKIFRSHINLSCLDIWNISVTINLTTCRNFQLLSPARVLSRTYRLGENSRWPKTTSFLGKSRVCPPEIFEMNMRWDAIWRFWDTILSNVTLCALTSSRLDDFSHIVTYILKWIGGIVGGGGSFYPSNTLERTLPAIGNLSLSNLIHRTSRLPSLFLEIASIIVSLISFGWIVKTWSGDLSQSTELKQPHPQGFSFAVPFSGDSLYHHIIDLVFSDIRTSLPYLFNAGGIVKT